MTSPRFDRVARPRVARPRVARQSARARAWTAIGGVLLAGACLLAAGCSAGGSSASSGSAAAAPGAVSLPARAAGGSSAANGGAALAALPAPASIIYTASLTVRAADITRAAAQATQLARAAGGYVSSENTALDRAHPDLSTVSLQLKIPVAAYPATLGTLGRLGTRLALSQHAQDVTETVADVTSRVTSAQAAITQLRALLAHAGSVADLLSVQNQINAEEASLESLQARQRALAHETALGTVSLLLVSKPLPVARKKAPGGFLGGLAAGWHGLVRAVSLLLTGAGAALPFAVILVPAGYLAYRRLAHRALRRGPAAGAESAPAD